MGENIDEVKGRTKRAAGELADDEDLKNEGTVDKTVSDVKDKVDEFADKVKERLGRDSDRDQETADRS